MFCPECGSETGDAKFCPECGADLAVVREAMKGRPAGRKTTGSVTNAKGGGKGAPREAAAPKTRSKGPSPALLWGIVGAVVVVVVVAVMLLTGNDSTGGGGTPAASASATPVAVDTSGSYQELVTRGNDLYDQGDTYFQSGQIDQGAQYFQAAAVAYMAAWKKKPGDPGVGTDLATALFYSGNTDGALKQIDSVLKANPDFQTAWYNKGNFLSHSARFAEQSGDKKQRDKLYAQAREAYTKAVAIDPSSDVGKQADTALQQLPK
jgi:hypothetical protein